MEILKCKRIWCDGYMGYNDFIDKFVCEECGTIEKCKRIDCEGFVVYNEDTNKCICDRCGAINE